MRSTANPSANGHEPHQLMESHKHLRFKTAVMILIMILAGPMGNVLLGKGMKSVGAFHAWPPSELAHTLLRVFSTGTIWLGIASLLTFFVAYVLVLSWADYSFVQPTSSMAYGVVAILSYAILHEHIAPMRWAGIAVVCCGVFVVGRTHPRTTEHH